jgi:hypothetical protein
MAQIGTHIRTIEAPKPTTVPAPVKEPTPVKEPVRT